MTKKLTVGETIEAVSRLQLKQAVLDELMRFLSQFIATDSYEPSKGISSPVSADVVPQDIVEEVKDELYAEYLKREIEIQELKGQSVVKQAKTPTKKGAKRAPPKKSPPKRRNTSGKRK